MSDLLPVIQRCTGHCCRAFTLRASPEELIAQHAARPILDGDQILAMIVYLGTNDASPADGRRSPDSNSD